MPLMRTFQLSKRRGNAHWTRPIVDRETKTISWIVQDNPNGVPSTGTVDRNGATCLGCGGAVKLTYVREQARAGNMDEVMTAIVAEGDRKRLFLSPTNEHIQTALNANPAWWPSQIMPNTPTLVSGRGFGITHWYQLFTERQLTALTTFSDLLAEVGEQAIKDGANEEYVNAICTYLALAIGRVANGSCGFTVWNVPGEKIEGVFSRQAIPMAWDFPEVNLFSSSTKNWLDLVGAISKVVERLPADVNAGEAHQADASTTIHAKDGPVIVTDPPYYDNIDYADLSDFFYVWLRTLLRDVYPDLFSGILTPKNEEMIATPFRFENPRERFEDLLNKTLRLIRERCSPEFPSSIFYAYKQQDNKSRGRSSTGWETMLTALVESGFQIIGTWPMRTERPTGVKVGANVLASSVVLVCRPRPEDAPVATRRQFFDALEKEIPEALDQLTQEGHIAPTDLAQAAIGPGMQIYSRYSRVETISGEPVAVREALAAINKAIADYDERQEGDLDSESRFCMDWLKTYGYGEGQYGEAETLARAKNVAIGNLNLNRLLTAAGGRVKLLPIDEYGDSRPLTLGYMTAWEGCFRMAYHLNREEGRGIEGAGMVARTMDGNVESIQRLARILYGHYDRKGDSQNAVIFNNLVTSWQDIITEMQNEGQRTLGI